MSLLRFPQPADARVAAELRDLVRQHGLPESAEHRVVARFLSVTQREGRSSAVGVMEARRLLRSAGEAALGGAA